MSKITVFGATGGTGRLVVQQALEMGHEVTVLTRDRSRVEAPVQRIVEGDVLDPVVVRAAVRDADAVVVTLGMPARDRSRLRQRGTRVIAEAMEAEGVSRLVVMSVLGAHESLEGLDWFTSWMVIPLWLKQTILDHEAQEEVVRATDLDWTLVRPPHLTEDPPTGSWSVGFDMRERPPAMKVPRGDVASFLLRCAEDGRWSRQAVGITGAVGRLAA